MTPLARIEAIDWETVSASLDDEGFALTPPFLSADECTRLRSLYDGPSSRFRSTISMQRYNFGRGEYKYFAYPLPPDIERMREVFYARLAPVANRWESRLRKKPDWPAELASLTKRCHEQGQCRPTPLMLRYEQGDYNCLHQDLYGDIHFPLQVVILLSEPDADFSGGELVLVEQRPRMQSRPIVVRLVQGAAAIIPVRERPRKGSRGFHRALMRHGVGEIVSGTRHTLGLIFHDAA